MWQLLGPQAVCVTENSWRPSPVARGRPPGPHPGSTRPSQRLSPRAGAGQYRTCTSVINCTHNQDACLYVKAVPLKVYRQCWSLEHCNFEFIANALGEKELRYDCCQKNLCNKSDGTSVSEKTPLLLTLLLVAVCRFYL